MRSTSPALAAARQVADEVLRPAAAQVDATGVLPPGHLDALAAAGLYGIAGPTGSGGSVDRATTPGVIELLAEACLATAFVWVQHQGVVRALGRTDAPGGRWIAGLCSGGVRAGVAVGGVRPGAVPLRAARDGASWVLDGSVPWVTGWGLIDVVHVAALDSDVRVRWLLVDAAESPTLAAERQRLSAVQASSTVTLVFSGHRVAGDRLTGTTSYAEWQAADVGSLRGNGSLALGLAARCAAAVGGNDLPAAIERARAALDQADESSDAQALAAARAAASALAWTAAGRLAVVGGGRSVLAGGVQARTVREAAFLLVFGSRPTVKAALLARLHVAG